MKKSTKNKSVDIVLMEAVHRNLYGQFNAERRQQYADSCLIYEDHTSPANFPSKSINKEFDPNRYVQSLTPKAYNDYDSYM